MSRHEPSLQAIQQTIKMYSFGLYMYWAVLIVGLERNPLERKGDVILRRYLDQLQLR